MVINTTLEPAEIQIPPQQLESFDFKLSTELRESGSEEDVPELATSEVHADSEDRIEKLKDMIPTDHLNEPEKLQVEEIIKEFNDIFFLPGDALGCAKNFTCKIRTIDDEPFHR